MPELPEVEVSRLGISPHLKDRIISAIDIRQPQLRWPVPSDIKLTEGQQVLDVRRRAKYLFIDTQVGSIVLHLGMSGKLSVLPDSAPLQKHDHLVIGLSSGKSLRLNDPRRFGACLWQANGAAPLPLLSELGPEPLTAAFDGVRLYQMSRGKQQAIKNFIMDNKVVVGVGNIYANESLFMAGIDPRRQAGKVSGKRYVALADCIKQVLQKAIKRGGTTLKDFTQADGKPGYFAQELHVYGRKDEQCSHCQAKIKSVVIGQRNSFYCPRCQR